MTRKQAGSLALLTLGCLALALLISQRLWFRLDFSRNSAYTIAPASRNLSAEIDGQVRITYFISDKLAAIHPVPGEIRDLLFDYAAYSHGRITVTLRDPVKADLVWEVEDLGILPQQIETIEQDQASIATVYTGILIEYLDRIDVLPSVFSLDTLEYDLTSRIRSLVRNTDRYIGILLGDATRHWDLDFRFLDSALRQAGYGLYMVSPGEEISESLIALMVLGGVEELDEWALYQIDRYIHRGGRILFALDAVGVDIENGFYPHLLEDSGLLAMVSWYGARVLPYLVLDASALTLPYQTSVPGLPPQIRFLQYPFWVALVEQFSNPGHTLSAVFPGLDLYWASPLELSPPEGVTGMPLFYSTPDAWLQTREFFLSPEDANYYGWEAEETRGAYIMGAALSGFFPSWFAGMGMEVSDTGQEQRSSRMVVVGDSDFATDLIQYTRSQRNLDFLIQAMDWLCMDDDIIAIRNRQNQYGRLDRIRDPAQRRNAMLFARTVNVILMPLALIIIGIVMCQRRRLAQERLPKNRQADTAGTAE